MKHKRNKDHEAEMEAAVEQAMVEHYQSMSEDELKKFSRTAEDFQHLFDDDLWYPLDLPEDFITAEGYNKPVFPTSERMRAQIKRHASKLGKDFQMAEYYFLKRLRDLQTFYGELNEFLKEADRANGTDLRHTLSLAVRHAFLLGQACPPEELTAPATEARSANKGRLPKWARFAEDILKNKPGLPPSDLGMAEKIHLDLVEKLKEHEVKTGQKIKPPSARTLRGYIPKLDFGVN
jgi:hypothetical protein